MRIKQVTMYHVQLPMKFNFKTAKTTLKLRDTIILQVENQEGLSGFGEVVSFTTPFYTSEIFESSWKKLEKDYIPSLLSLELSHPFEIHDYFKEPFPMAIAGLENALLDLCYKEKNENLMSSLFHEKLQAQIPRGAVLGDMALPQLFGEIKQLEAHGVRRIKLKIKPEDGFERTKFAVEKFPQLTFAVDANQSFRPKEDREQIQKFDDLNLVCIEEPFQSPSFSELTELSAQMKTPLCFDESVQTLEQLKAIAKLPGKTMLNVKIGRLGGLYQTQQAIHFCRENGIDFWIGSMVESGISKILHVQLAALSDNVMAGDLSDSSHYFEEDLISPEIIFRNGFMTVPFGTGIGVTVNTDALQRYSVKKEIFK